MILPVQQNPADLVLTIAAGGLPVPLTILKQASLSLGAWTLNFHIIGESHLVTIEYAGTPVLLELLACVDVAAESARHQQRFHDLRPHCFEQAGYSVDVRFDNRPEQEPMTHLLEVVFPQTAGQTPVTRIAWANVSDHAIQWRTLHVYPHEGQPVCVHSLSYLDTLKYNRAS